MAQPSPLIFAPGIQRDGTRFASDALVDGRWCRFKRGRPAKIGGYRMLTDRLESIPRGLSGFNLDGKLYVHAGGANRLERAIINPVTGATSALVNRTPAAFAAHEDNVWQIETIFDVVTGKPYIAAHATPSARNIDSSTLTTIWIGATTETGQLTAAAASITPDPMQVTGGIVALHPYLLGLCCGGRVFWSVPGTPGDFYSSGSGDAVITSQKLICGKRTRGPDGGPSGLIWSLDTLIRVSFAGSPAVFSFNEVALTSVLSPASIVEYDGIYFWPTPEGFVFYNGAVREVQNRRNLDYFLDNINYAERGKIFGFANRRFNEIWWVAPLGTATEPNHAFIYNVATQDWYDTPIPNSNGRSCALTGKLFPYPIMGGVDQKAGEGYHLWQHEVGADEIDGQNRRIIRSYFETPDISLLKGQQPQNTGLRGAIFQPDFVQTGDLILTVKGNANGRDTVREADPIAFSAPPVDASEQVIPLKDASHRQLRLKIESNAERGHYEMGQCYLDVEPTGDKQTS